MHLIQVSIENMRSIRSLRWSIPEERGAGWHVILGENGTGKTTFLRLVALALLGQKDAFPLWPIWGDWIHRNATEGRVEAKIVRDEEFDPIDDKSVEYSDLFGFRLASDGDQGLFTDTWEPQRTRLCVWNSKAGWLSAAYGPFRRFSGGDAEYERELSAHPRIARHLSLFSERVALTESIAWLKELHHQKLEAKESLRTNGASLHDTTLLDRLIGLINQPGFLPHDTRLIDVSSRGVHFEDGNGARIAIEQLSDGYRSILSLTLDLLRRLVEAFGPEKVFTPDGSKIAPPGVVLIDEIDAHLHPTWQHEVGLWFKKHFPRIQFIVTTHSPIVCQAADTVFVLPRPGTDHRGRMLKGIDLDRLRYGDVLDAYGTGVFGQGVTRSKKSKQKLRRLAELNIKELEHGLSDEERREQSKLRSIMPTASPLLNGADGERGS